ncbi:hypothetical protein OSTOST_18508, partial [Ostertagia ostertagi]
ALKAAAKLKTLSFQPALGQAGAPVIQPFTLPPTQSPTPMFPGLIAPQLTVQVQPGIPPSGGGTSLRNVPNPAAPQLGPIQQLPPGLHFPQGQMPQVPARHFAGVSQPPTPPPVVLPGQTALAGQVPPAQGAALGLPAPAVSPPPPSPPRVEV